jgi:hypothetical protein
MACCWNSPVWSTPCAAPSTSNATWPSAARVCLPNSGSTYLPALSVGDIIFDADVFGDGVNVDARLQRSTEPGRFCVCPVVRDRVLDKLRFASEDLGP